MEARRLSTAERDLLERQGCRAESWDAVRVAEGFDPARVHGSSFSGRVTLGAFRGTAVLPDGVRVPTGVFDCFLRDASVGDDALLWRVHRVQGYDIGARAVVANVGSLTIAGESGFGNGTQLEVLNEAGGRTLVIHDRLSAPAAYLMALYRHRPGLVAGLERAVERAVAARRSSRGGVGEAAVVVDCGEIREVRIGAAAVIRGAVVLEDGTVASSAAAPVAIGPGVSARHFIVLGDSVVDGGAILERCFVGQGVRLGRQLSAESSAFFANAEAFHGEIVSVLAGPCTVTHHKSTLLIGGLFSFFNAGSSTNQSNHMYKLGPVHQGVLERGCKTGSSAYLRWPSRVGAFTVVMGHHHTAFDSSDLPFSYLSETGGRSVLTPAMNLLSVGTRRDSEKWPKRDRRSAPDRLDPITFGLLNPYTVERILRGHRTLSALAAQSPATQDLVSYRGVHIPRLLLRTAARYYEMAIDVFIGSRVAGRLERDPCRPRTALAAAEADAGQGWVDLCGLVAPQDSVERLVTAVETGRIDTVEGIQEELARIHAASEEREWAYCARLVQERMGRAPAELGREELRGILERWRDGSVKWNNMILSDAAKEYDPSAQIGFGIDGGDEERRRDFQAVRGGLEDSPFVRGLREDSEATRARAGRLLAAIAALEDR